MSNQIELYTALYHGTAAILQPGVDFLKPFGNNANKINAVFATSFFPKAAACALLSKRNLQNKIVGRGNYCYLWMGAIKTLVLHPGFDWYDNTPGYVYKVDKTNFLQLFHNKSVKNEYISRSPVKIEAFEEIITKESLQKNDIKLYTAKSVETLAAMHRLADISNWHKHSHILENLCQRII
jgi:hypothetical protein